MKKQENNINNTPENIQAEVFEVYGKYISSLAELMSKISFGKNSSEHNFDIIGSTMSSIILITHAWSRAICGEENSNKILEESMLHAMKEIEKGFGDFEYFEDFANFVKKYHH